MDKTVRGTTERLLTDIGTAVRDSEGFLKTWSGEKRRELRVKLQPTIDKANEACRRIGEKSAGVAKATDQTVRDHPYEAIGIAFGVGLLIGVLATRSWRA